MAGKGLYANIHAKRKRGGKMRKKAMMGGFMGRRMGVR